jgi:hypothetical protein
VDKTFTLFYSYTKILKGENVSKNFDTFKEKTYDSLRQMISGDTNIILGMIETLLQAQAKDLEVTFSNEKINALTKKIDELESEIRKFSK